MAKNKNSRSAAADRAAEGIGHALGTVAGRIDSLARKTKKAVTQARRKRMPATTRAKQAARDAMKRAKQAVKSGRKTVKRAVSRLKR